MKPFWSGTNKFCPLLLLLLWMLYDVEAQSSSFYHHEYYRPLVSRPRHYFRRSNGFEPFTYAGDLIPEESKRKVSPKKYSKPVPNRPTFHSDEEDFSLERFRPGEYSDESRGPSSSEQDSHEYTIGTQIHVQHPITVPKKISTLRPKPTKHSLRDESFGSDGNVSSEIPSPDSPSALPLKKRPSKYTSHYDADPFHVIPPPKTTSPGLVASSSIGYNVYENDFGEYRPTKKSLLNTDRFKSVASKKQIEAYLQDQQKKLLDEALKIQLISNPEFKQFLKQKEKQRFEREHRQLYNEEDGIISPPVPPPSVFLENLEEGITFTTSRPRRRPSESKRSPKRKLPGTAKPNRKFRSVVIEV